MTKVNFYDSINDSMLKFAVIIARHNGKWVFCKHKERNTWEAPGGHREDGEDILETAKRELYEETGAITFDITPICIYSVTAPLSAIMICVKRGLSIALISILLLSGECSIQF